MISPITVLARDVPPLVLDLLANAIASEPDMTLESTRAQAATLRRADAGPDVVIMTAAGDVPVESVRDVLVEWPRAQVLLIALDGHDCVLYEQRVHSTRLGELSPRELVDAIRTAVRDRSS